MALQGSGTITLNDIAGEFGGSTPHSISEYYRSGGLVPNSGANSNIPTSGTISFSQFYNGTNISQIGSITVNSLGTQSASIGKVTTTITGVTLARGALSASGGWGDRNADAANSVIDTFITQTNGIVTTSFLASVNSLSGLSGSQMTTPNGSTTSVTGGFQVKDFTTSNLHVIGQFLVDGTNGSNTPCRYGFHTPAPATGTSVFIA